MTSRNARDAGLLAAHQDDRRARSIQMKMNPASFGLLSKDDREVSSATHIYLFVNLRGRQADYDVVPSRVVKRLGEATPVRSGGSIWHAFSRQDAEPRPRHRRMRSVANSADRAPRTSSTHCRASFAGGIAGAVRQQNDPLVCHTDARSGPVERARHFITPSEKVSQGFVPPL